MFFHFIFFMLVIQVNAVGITENEVVKSFESIGPDSFPGVVGAMGAKYLTITAPAWFIDKQGKICKEENLKQDIAVQAISDSKCFFTSVHIAWLEVPEHVSKYLRPTKEMKKITRVHPAEVFYRSPFHIAAVKKVKNNPSVDRFALPGELHVVADSTYPLMEAVMVPFTEEDEAQDSQDAPARRLFNKLLHNSRSVVDIAFGKLFGRLPRASFLDPQLQRSVGLILSCFAIHNFCMREDDDFEAEAISLPERPVKRNFKVEEAALSKRSRICQEIRSGEINSPADPVRKNLSKRQNLSKIPNLTKRLNLRQLSKSMVAATSPASRTSLK